MKKNKKGGFTIYLDESVIYYFEIVEKADGSIKLVSANGIGNMGDFEMR